MGKVVVRVKGGLGNQLFCYAAARRLALANKADLVIDHVSGFARDVYRRKYALEHFNINVRKAAARERLEPFERYRRGIKQWWNRRKPFLERIYVEQEGIDFDERLLNFKVREVVYVDGLWQSESYFKDVEPIIRRDLQIRPPTDAVNREIAHDIRRSAAVALHVRWFDAPGTPTTYNLAAAYYSRAIALMQQKVRSPHFFLFSDDPEAARLRLALPVERTTVVSHNVGDEAAYADLWLMSQCRHFITANSTFSWWGAWLAPPCDKIVITPRIECAGVAAWGFRGLIPDSWNVL
jgi:hypothetical protein